MCGIVAVLSSKAVNPTRLGAALENMRRRGPDGKQAWWSEDGTVGLGHTRLAINDPEGGDQPFFWGAGERYVGVVNGEFYGPDLDLKSDCWRLADAWRQGFPDLLESLRGEFAWMVYDQRERKLYAARDRFGIKPLFWAEYEGEVWLASSASALWAAGLRAAWSETGFWHASATQYPPLGGSLFEGVHELSPAQWMTFDIKGRAGGRYWRLPLMVERAGPAGDHIEAFATSLEEAVRLRLRSDEVTAVQLSGGVDSASVLALACGAGSEKLHAFSVDFLDQKHPSYSEGALARAQCAHLGVEHHTVLGLNARELVEGLEATVQGTLGTMVNTHGVAKFRLAEAIAETGIKVCLSGEGADELLFGYRHFLPHLPSGAAVNPLDDPAGLGILTSRGGQHRLEQVTSELGFCPDIWVSKWALGERIDGFLKRDYLAAYAARDPFMECLATADLDPSMKPWEVVRSLWCSTALRAYILEVLGDGCEMAHSVEGRPPFLDHRLWEQARHVPLSLTTAAPGKGILRKALGGRLIPEISARPKHPFMAPPLGETLREELRRVVLERDHPFVDRTRALARLQNLERLEGPDAWEWEPALLWLLSTYHLQALWA